jgi:sugar lactone lactonase YvrE
MTQRVITAFIRGGLSLTLLMLSFLAAEAQTFPGVLTQHNDNARTGQNLYETVLTPENVTPSTFGRVFSYSVDGQIYSQPLYVPNVSIPGQGIHNVVYVETQNDSVYAFDADGLSPTALWQISFVNPAAGITPVPCATDASQDIACGVYPVYGITSTPVIDSSTNTMYLLARTSNKGTFLQTLHALDIATGAEKFGGPVNISGSFPGTGSGSNKGIIKFNTLQDLQRPGLLLANGTVYIAWAGAMHGWIMGYNAQTLKQTSILNTTPNAERGGIWASGNGLAADDAGNIYASVGDAIFDANTGGPDYGDSVLKLNSSLAVVDYFTPKDQNCRELHNLDLGAGGPMLVPGTQPTLLVSGKGGSPCDSNPAGSPIYVISQTDLGEYSSSQDNDLQTISGSPGGFWSSPAYWQGPNGAYVYSSGVKAIAGTGDALKMFSVSNGLLSTTPIAQSSNILPVGATPSVSANGTADGIVWAIERPDALGIQPGVGAAVLYAYDATNITNPLYSSAQALSQGVPRDSTGCANKFAVPTIANGKVYVGTQNELDVFGVLGTASGPGVYLANPCWAPNAPLGTPFTQTFELTNNGNSLLTVSNVAIAGTNAADFTQTNTCSSVQPGAQCAITVTFTASIVGPETANVMISDNAVGSPQNMYIIGVGLAKTVLTWPQPAPITYGTALTGTQLNASANVPGTFVYTPAAGTILGAGSQTLSVTFTPTNNSFKPATTTVQLQVNPSASVITWSTPAPIAYGTALSGAQLNATANVPGTFSYSPGTGAVLGAGTQSLSVMFTPSDSIDYSSASSSVLLQVNPGSLTVTASNAVGVYGQSLPLLGYTISGFVNGDTQTTATSGAPSEGTTATPTSTPGTYPIVISQGSLTAANYAFTTFVSGVLTLQQSTSAVSLSAQSNTLSSGQSTTLTATVSITGSGTAPTQTVNFMSGTTLLGTGTLSLLDTTDSTATLILNASQLAPGANTITAVYAGDPNYSGSTSSAITVTLLTSQYNFGFVPVGSTSSVVTLTYTFTNGATLSAVSILTAGASGLDYADAGNSTCTANASFTSGQSCVVNVTLKPSVPGVRPGAVVLFAQGSNLPLTTWYVSGYGQSAAVTMDPGTQSTLAQLSNNGQAYGSAIDGAGNVYVVDNTNSQVVKLAAGTLTQSPVVTSGLLNPTAVVIDGAGNLYISDTGNSRVVVVPNEQGTLNSLDMSPVNISQLSSPSGLAVDSSGNLYVVDAINGDVLELPSGTMAPVVLCPGLTNPQGIAVDSAGNVFVSGNNQVTEYPAGNGTPISTGTGYNNPRGLALDLSGALYVADSGNARIVRVAPGGASQSTLTVAGSISPQGVSLDGSGNVFVSDAGNVYELNRKQAAPLVFSGTGLGSISPAQIVTVTNLGSQPLTVSSLTISANFTQQPSGGTDCSASTQLSPGTQCLAAIAFAPTSAGTVTGTFSLGDNALGVPSTQTVQLSGTSSSQSSQTITFPVIPTQTYGGSPTTLTATASSGLPVSYTVLSGPATVSGNILTLTGAGSVTVEADQAGNSQYSPAPPVSQTFTVNQATQTITFTQNAPASAPYNSSFTVAATASSGLPVTFTSGGACSQVGATFTITSGTGTCTVTASQSGDSNYLAAQPVNQSTTAQPAAPTVSLTGLPPTAPFQSTYSVVATSNSGVTATITATGKCSISGTTVTITSGSGKCTVTAKWAATQNYLAATASQSATVVKATSGVTWPTPASIPYGTPLSAVQLDATANTAGTFVYTPPAGTILGVGTHTLALTFTPTQTQLYYSSTVKVPIVITKTATTSTVTSHLPNPSVVGQAVTVQFTVVPATGYGTPTGRVSVNGGAGVTCSATLTAGSGSCALTFQTKGPKRVAATYAGDVNDSPSAAAPVQQFVNSN